MTYKEAVDKKEKYKYLIGKPLNPVNPDHMVINEILIASYNTISKILVHTYNGMDNKSALMLTGFDNDLDIFLVYKQTGGINGYYHIDQYLSKFPPSQNQ